MRKWQNFMYIPTRFHVELHLIHQELDTVDPDLRGCWRPLYLWILNLFQNNNFAVPPDFEPYFPHFFVAILQEVWKPEKQVFQCIWTASEAIRGHSRPQVYEPTLLGPQCYTGCLINQVCDGLGGRKCQPPRCNPWPQSLLDSPILSSCVCGKKVESTYLFTYFL